MLKEVFAIEFFAQVGEAVGPFVQIWLVYLVYITGENYLGSLASASNDGFYFMRGKVLGLVYYKEGIGEGAPADVGKRTDEQLLAAEHLLYFYVFFTGVAEILLYYGKIVVKRKHVRANLLLGVAGKESYLLVLEWNYRAGKEYLVVEMGLCQGSCQSNEGLSCAGGAG